MAINGMATFAGGAVGYAPGNGNAKGLAPLAKGEEKKAENGQQQALSEAERRKMSESERSRYDTQMERALSSKQSEVLSGMQQQIGNVSEQRSQLESQLDNVQGGNKAALEYNASQLASQESNMSRNYSYEYARTLAAVLSLDPSLLEE